MKLVSPQHLHPSNPKPVTVRVSDMTNGPAPCRLVVQAPDIGRIFISFAFLALTTC
jgi:hypothetical protein